MYIYIYIYTYIYIISFINIIYRNRKIMYPQEATEAPSSKKVHFTFEKKYNSSLSKISQQFLQF